MQIGIQTRGFDLTPALRAYCERRMRFALGSSSGKVRSVLIRLTDENGPKGGIDKRCSIRVVLHEAPIVVIVQDESDVYVAIDRAADRIARAISRRLDRTYSTRRVPPRAQRDGTDIDTQLN